MPSIARSSMHAKTVSIQVALSQSAPASLTENCGCGTIWTRANGTVRLPQACTGAPFWKHSRSTAVSKLGTWSWKTMTPAVLNQEKERWQKRRWAFGPCHFQNRGRATRIVLGPWLRHTSPIALAKWLAVSKPGNCHRVLTQTQNTHCACLPKFPTPAFTARKCCACHSKSCACHESSTAGSENVLPAKDFWGRKGNTWENTCNQRATHVRATRRATRSFLLQIPLIFAQRCKMFSFPFWNGLGAPKVARKAFWS